MGTAAAAAAAGRKFDKECHDNVERFMSNAIALNGMQHASTRYKCKPMAGGASSTRTEKKQLTALRDQRVGGRNRGTPAVACCWEVLALVGRTGGTAPLHGREMQAVLVAAPT